MTIALNGVEITENDWFLSDTHFGHTNIIKYCNRPFFNAHEMNRVLTANWNARVEPKDRIFFLGDFSLCKSSSVPKILDKLNGYKILIKGNHDKGLNRMKELGFDEAYDAAWGTYSGISGKYSDKGLLVLMEHHPNYDRANEHDYHLCGHVHNAWARHENIINVSADVTDFEPKTLPELLERDKS